MGNFLYYTFKTADLQDKYNYMFSFGWHIKQNYFRYDTKKNTKTKLKKQNENNKYIIGHGKHKIYSLYNMI